jgi:hypothetical protein
MQMQIKEIITVKPGVAVSGGVGVVPTVSALEEYRADVGRIAAVEVAARTVSKPRPIRHGVVH